MPMSPSRSPLGGYEHAWYTAHRETRLCGGVRFVTRRSCQVCRLGLCDGGEPYVVPLCFGYDGEALYFHAAPDESELRQ